jgi:hypothetical protein
MSQVKTYMWNNRIATVTPVTGGFEVYCGHVHKDGERQPSRRFGGTCCKTFKFNKKAMIEVHAFLNSDN